MAYQLLFRVQEPAFELLVPKGDWDHLSLCYPQSEDQRAYLREDVEWKHAQGELGYGGCGKLKEEWGRMRTTFAIERYTLNRSLLSLSYLLQNLNYFRDARDAFYTVENACGSYLSVHGRVSQDFRDKLARLPENSEAKVLGAMRAAHRASAPQNLVDYDDDCRVHFYRDEKRFVLCCIGNACDVAIYPDQDHGRGRTDFSCHNVDASFQQATLLAGVCTLGELLREMR